jgi:serine kinase of HPr protein (carbohydrate metabolism regulator)
VKSDTQANKVLLVGEDGMGKDETMMEDIIHGTIKIDGLSI